MKKYDVFISCCESELRRAEKICNILKTNNISAYLSSDSTSSEPNSAECEKNIFESAPLFIAILSQNSQSSPVATERLTEALQASKVIFPIIAEEFTLNEEYNFLLSQTQRFNVFMENDSAMEPLIAQIKNTLSSLCTKSKKKKFTKTAVILSCAVFALLIIMLAVFLVIRLSPEEEPKAGIDFGITGRSVWVYRKDTKVLEIGCLDGYDMGVMADFSDDSPSPWNEYVREIETVIIHPGLLNISSRAFQNCTNLSSITIPDSVNNIGSNAFYLCRSLENIELPEDLSSIGDYAFAGCSSLREIELPSDVSLDGGNIFVNCDAKLIYEEYSYAHISLLLNGYIDTTNEE